jgi:hypothetical protein
MSKGTSLRVTMDAYGEFNRLKIRVATDTGRIHSASEIIAALLVVGNRYYSDVQFALGEEGEPE